MASSAKMLRVSFVQCRGTPYEVGRAQADAFAATRNGKAFLRKRLRLPWWLYIRTEERAFRALHRRCGKRSAESPMDSKSRWSMQSRTSPTKA
jgi:hypothetical protein